MWRILCIGRKKLCRSLPTIDWEKGGNVVCHRFVAMVVQQCTCFGKGLRFVALLVYTSSTALWWSWWVMPSTSIIPIERLMSEDGRAERALSGESSNSPRRHFFDHVWRVASDYDRSPQSTTRSEQVVHNTDHTGSCIYENTISFSLSSLFASIVVGVITRLLSRYCQYARPFRELLDDIH